MDTLVCIKRVPMVGGRIALSPDRLRVDTEMLGFTVSPHEECAVEEAVQMAEREGGAVTVLTLGPPEADEQLRSAISVGAHAAVLLSCENEAGPIATSAAITAAVRSLEEGRGSPFDLVLFGNEAADSGDYQVGVRVAHALGRQCATAIKAIETAPGELRCRREYRGVEELFSLALPAVVTVKEGINLPRYPSLPGRMRAKKADVAVASPEMGSDPVRTEYLAVPVSDRKAAQVLGHGPDAVPALVSLLVEIGVVR